MALASETNTYENGKQVNSNASVTILALGRLFCNPISC
jgi:hypothetical protein